MFCYLASMEIFQRDHSFPIPPYFGRVLEELSRISQSNFKNWLLTKSKNQSLLSNSLIYSSSMDFLKRLNESHIMKPFMKRLPVLVSYYSDIVFAMDNLHLIFSDSINDTIYYEMLQATPTYDKFTDGRYIKFTPLF